MVYNSVADLVGNTPLLKLNNIMNKEESIANVYAKLEYLNPAGSIKDRVAKNMILDLEKQGKLKKGSTIIEPTSGNTGIGLASIGVSRGYNVIIVMPNNMSKERIDIIKAYGAKMVLTDSTLGMKGAIAKAEELSKEIAESVIAGQFDNYANPEAHYLTTAPEIYNDLDGNVDIIVSTIGTGGTISGIAKYLKEKNSNIKIIGVEPSDSPFITKGIAGAHKIQGIGAGFIPKTLDLSLIDEVVTCSNEDAFKMGRIIGKAEGILVGISSGAALNVGIILSKMNENKDKNIVCILPDTGDRYLSTEMFSE